MFVLTPKLELPMKKHCRGRDKPAPSITKMHFWGIYINDGEKLNFVYTQNDTLQSQLSEREKLIFSTFSIPINDKSIAGSVALTG